MGYEDNLCSAVGLEAMMYPQSVAIVGATSTPDRVGYNLLDSILYGRFNGPVYPVHPRHETLLGQKVYRSLQDIPGKVDLALVALNQKDSVDVVKSCAEKGVKGVVCISGGYRETGGEGVVLEQELRRMANTYGIPMIGPNTLGFINNHADLYATFYPMLLPKGGVSFVSQSGGVGMTFLCQAADAGLGISKWVGAGNRTGLEFADYLEYLGSDSDTKVIGLLVEGSENAADLVRTAGRLSKPVVVYKVGRSEAVDFATLTHTGSITGSYQVYSDIFRQFGLHQVETMMEMIAALRGLAVVARPSGPRLGIMTHTAGPSIVAADILISRGHILPQLSQRTLEKIRKLTGPNPPLVLKNPLDVAALGFATAPWGEYLDIMCQDPDLDIILAIYAEHKTHGLPTKELIKARELWGKPIIACCISRPGVSWEDRRELDRHGIPMFTTPEEAAWATDAVLAWSRKN